ncbi:MAG: hypothetical protein ABIZ80_06285, partial [Bryobacteraceae bacterium]
MQEHAQRVLLRVVLAGDLSHPVELTGSDILRRASELAAPYAREREAVLILLPHSVDLFLLQIGLVLNGSVPAILPWPTSRMDPEKYQRNLLHQLRELPAAQMVTLPELAANLSGKLAYPALGHAIAGGEQHAKRFSSEFVCEELGDAYVLHSDRLTGVDP